MIEAELQREVMKLDRLQQLANGIDAINGAEHIMEVNNGRPFHAAAFDPNVGYVVFRLIDHQVVQMMKGGILGAYRELKDEGSKATADRIVFKHTK